MHTFLPVRPSAAPAPTSRRAAAPLLLVAALAACGDNSTGAPGTLEVRVYGEEFIEEMIPAAEMSDGWSVTFDKFLVSIGNPAAQAGHDADEVSLPGFKIFDLAQPSAGQGYVVASGAAPGGTYDHFGYQIKADAAATAGNASAADVTAMRAAGASVWVTGSASKDGVTKTFDWQFTMGLTHAHCELADAIDGDTLTVQATIHGDHLFYDDAVSATPMLAFQALADADVGAGGGASDGAITLAELAAVDITGFARYQVGSLPITDLRGYLEHMVGTVGHVNGEGHCEDVFAAP